ncbi:MAG: hypothetical protein A2075_16445 [Geobacteraceae bacterium GWC2_58_44]|nr:MAG: hypothetical protein A2075_16445 [Geobacteraceae bacterium GWC2_58_44]HBG07023.1 hypothetical protein [Geobacter sp.]
MNSDNRLIDARLVTWSVLFSLFSVPYVDIWSRGATGTAISVAIFAAVLCLALFRTHLAILAVVLLQITIPAFPRDIIDAYSALQVSKSVSYNTICSLNFASLALIQHLTFLVAIVALYKLIFSGKELFLGKNQKIYLAAFCSSALLATLYFTFSQNENVNLREIVTNVRLPLFLFCGILYFNYLYHFLGMEKSVYYLNRVLLAITIIMGVRVPFFILSGIKAAIPSLDLGVIPHIPIAVVLTIFFLIEQDRGNRRSYLLLLLLSVFGLVSPSRGHMAILVLSSGVFLFINGLSARYLKYLGVIAAMFIIPVIFVFMFNERLFDFILWKLSFFTGNVSDSGKMRVYEFNNILAEALNNPPYLLFGKGLTGFFTFIEHPLPRSIVLDLKSYTQDEIASGRYYHPHFFTNFILLKYGALGLFVYVVMVFDYFKCGLQGVRSAAAAGYGVQMRFFCMTSAILSVSMLLEMFFRNYYALLFAMTLPFLYKARQHSLNNREELNEDTVPVT